MGASKRLAELCMQAIYNNNPNINTNFSIVRFGNVLESSGSVIPKFKKQIKDGDSNINPYRRDKILYDDNRSCTVSYTSWRYG